MSGTVIGLLVRRVSRGRGRTVPARGRRRVAVVAGLLAVLLALAGVAAVPAAAGISYSVTATIGVGNVPTGVGVDPATGTVYVANL